jgi:hypothetical protein
MSTRTELFTRADRSVRTKPAHMSATTGRRRTIVMGAALVGLVAVLGAALTLTVVLSRHSHPSPAPTSHSTVPRLDHAAVEQQIENWGYTDVVCNHGDNPQIIVHTQFTCIAAGNQLIVVTITTAGGNYVWGPTR